MPEVLTSEGPITADEPDLSIFENKSGLAEDLKFLASMPELCDVTFLVGETREPVCAVKVNRIKCFKPDRTFFAVSSSNKSCCFTMLYVLKNVEYTESPRDSSFSIVTMLNRNFKLNLKHPFPSFFPSIFPGDISIALSSLSENSVSSTIASTEKEGSATARD